MGPGVAGSWGLRFRVLGFRSMFQGQGCKVRLFVSRGEILQAFWHLFRQLISFGRSAAIEGF